jgi:hypothetical protein
VVQGRPWLRSVDSERAGRVIEPRNHKLVGADAVAKAEGNIVVLVQARHVGPTGVVEQGMYARGTHRNLGDPAVSRLDARRGGYCRAKETKRSGTDGGKSECLNRTEEVGEPSRGTPRRKGRHRCKTYWRER